MKKLKRITALILSVLMLMSMSVAVSATDYTIVVTNTNSGYVYTAYQIFSGEMGTDSTSGAEVLKKIYWSTNITESTALYEDIAAIYDEDSGKYPFTQDNTATGDPWYSAATVAAVLADYSSKDAVVQEFAKVVYSYINKSGSAIYTSTQSGTEGSYVYTLSVDAGYYLIETTTLPTNTDGSNTGAYTEYILVMTSSSGEGSASYPIEAKSDLPNIDKDISDLDANIGDTVTYYLTASLPSNYDSYSEYTLVFYDTLYQGLTFNENSVEVYVYNDSDYDTNVANAKDQTVSGTQVDSGSYTVSATSTNSDGDTEFTVTLSDTKILSDGTNTISTDEYSLIQVVFTADLNYNAIIGGEGNDNEVYLKYSNSVYNDSMGQTVTDRVVTWTYEIDVIKVDADDTTYTLPDAEFVLYRINDSGVYEYVQVDANNRVAGWVTDIDDASTLTSNASGKFSVIGLDVGTYYLLETKAPKGYNKMSDPVSVEIKADYTKIDAGTWLSDDYVTLDTFTANGKEVTSATDGKVSVTVENNTGAKLPSTGGIGTTIFYIVGGVLVVGAIILLITKKRMGGDDK